MESIIISQPKLSVMIFWAFSRNRLVVGNMEVKAQVGTGEFIWKLGDYGKPYLIDREKMNSLNYEDLENVLSKEWHTFLINTPVETDKKPTTAELVTKEKELALCDAASPLINFMHDNFNPHCTAIVTNDSVEIVEGVMMHRMK